ncbi:MAG TPA: cytochrome c [Acidobacteriota bacterium]|nr:cytochrome c [Acidobacteriota bacterium]
MIEKYVNAEELKRLIAMLVVVLGCLIIAGLFASIVVPGLRNANRPATPATVTPVAGDSGWLNPEEYPAQKGSVIPPVDPRTLIEPSAELVALGKNLFEKNCTQCHGALGHGDGPAAATMNPKPRNLSGSEGWKNGPEIPGIYKTISEGIRGTAMSSFDYLAKKDRMALVHYVQSLASFPRKNASPQSMEALTAQLASAGETIPNRIPVSTAMDRLRTEYTAPPPLAVHRSNESAGAGILLRVLADPDRAALFLARSQSWKKSAKDLASSILADAPANGFSVGSATLNAAEWQELYAELLKQAHSQ